MFQKSNKRPFSALLGPKVYLWVSPCLLNNAEPVLFQNTDALFSVLNAFSQRSQKKGKKLCIL
ncbi:hypothetical protein A1343_18060 [Leptospira interrogans serovar Bataviae]|nr:hypothetical protein [Leptospira interrogans serovar Bataviae]OAM85450.1 hypothetical protein A1343_18060 [Leptospira interrogans serovar Bataviae]QOI36864.1 hypothetical protein Lepto1548_00165 [Leptospira interrogans serovar Bataviae]QOI38354.1 hypothetical protein Lepto1548_08730 [Leptospira interrogans serovar Bataviae]